MREGKRERHLKAYVDFCLAKFWVFTNRAMI